MLDLIADVKSIPITLVLIAIFLCAQLLKGVFELYWKIKEKQEAASETTIQHLIEAMSANTKATTDLDGRLKALESIFMELPKFKKDLRRLFTALKLIAGDEWSEIRKEIMTEDHL